jgi:hypothetical protein
VPSIEASLEHVPDLRGLGRGVCAKSLVHFCHGPTLSQASQRVEVTPAIRTELVLAMARSAVLGGIVGGQMFDVEAKQATEPHTVAAVSKLRSMKTGALVLSAVDAGAVRSKSGQFQLVAVRYRIDLFGVSKECSLDGHFFEYCD